MLQGPLHTLAKRYLSGEQSAAAVLFEELSKAVIRIPILSISEDESGVARVKFARIEKLGNLLVPVFVCDEDFTEWQKFGGNAFTSLPLTGQELGMLLTENDVLLLNPETELELEIPVTFLKQCNSETEIVEISEEVPSASLARTSSPIKRSKFPLFAPKPKSPTMRKSWIDILKGK